MNETKTVSITRKRLLHKGYLDAEHPLGIGAFHVEEQKSDNPRISKLLATASKKGNAGGRPEFIITRENCMNTVIVVECKASLNRHESPKRDQYADYAIDGVLCYASFLCKEFNVIAVAVSGEKESLCKTDVFKVLKGSMKLGLEAEHIADSILRWEDFQHLIDNDPETTKKERSKIIDYSRDLHDLMRDEGELTEQEKPLLVSAVLIGLYNKTFAKSYETAAQEKNGAHNLSMSLLLAVRKELSNSNLPQDKIDNMLQPYDFIPVHQQLNEGDLLLRIIRGIDDNLKPYMVDHRDMDVVGRFYGEFLRYTGGDKKFGIVLTPGHVTEIFTELANVQVDSTVFDLCMGTAGFLISSMAKMVQKAQGDEDKIKRIKQSGLVGIEQQANMYALAAANMILRDDGKANLILDSCFDDKLTDKIRGKHPTIGMINPPYSKKNDEYSELSFVRRMLDLLDKNGIGVAIVPMSCAISYSPVKEEILKHHTLVAVMSMPNQLFYPVGTVTCIMVFRAHNAHVPTVASWFGYWKNDGFEIVRNQGRIDAKGLWAGIRETWLDDYRNRREVAGRSVSKKVSGRDEWCAEAYMETDFLQLRRTDFEKTVRQFVAYRVFNDLLAEDGEGFLKNSLNQEKLELDIPSWKSFNYTKLFDITGSKTTPVEQLEHYGNGDHPYVTTQATNNGVSGFYAFRTEKRNVLTVDSAVAGYCSYQGSDFSASDHVEKLMPKFALNIYNGIFLATVVNVEQYRYSYGRKCSQRALKKSTIKLPVTPQGDPDWVYMERYVKSLPYSGGLKDRSGDAAPLEY